MAKTTKSLIKRIWNWLLTVPDEGQIAKVALESMQNNVAQLAETLAKLVEADKQASLKYEAKRQEATELLKKAQAAYQSGQDEAAKIVMTQVLVIEKMLPHLEQVAERSHQVVFDVTQKLSREQEKIEIYKLQIEHLTFFREINTILENIVETTNQSPFNDLRDQIENLKINMEFIDPEYSCEQLLDQLNLDEQIEQRLPKKI